MENNNVFGEAVPDGGDTSAKKDQKTTGQDVQPTNSDATKPSANKKAQDNRGIDKEICQAIDDWANKSTPEAKRLHKQKGYTLSQYIGRKLYQAGVPYKKGLSFLKAKFPDMVEVEYKKGYYEIFGEKLRELLGISRRKK